MLNRLILFVLTSENNNGYKKDKVFNKYARFINTLKKSETKTKTYRVRTNGLKFFPNRLNYFSQIPE